jgi:HSP20 family protein
MRELQETKEMSRRPQQDVTRAEKLSQGPHIQPDVDVLDRPDEILVRADMPGVGADGVDARFENGIVTLSGVVKLRAPAKGGYLAQEYEPFDFYRQFVVGEGVDQSRISAEYEGGVLTLHLPKSESAKSRRIEIKRK